MITPTILAARDELQQTLDFACELAELDHLQASDGQAYLHQLCLAARSLAKRLQVHELRDGDVSDHTIADGIAAAVSARSAARGWLGRSFRDFLAAPTAHPTITTITGARHD